MKKIKYIIGLVLISLGLLITGDLFQNYIGSYNNFHATVVHPQTVTNNDAFITDITGLANSCNIEVMYQNLYSENLFSTTRKIYCTDKSKKTLSSDYYINEKVYNSIFLGKTTVEINDFKHYALFYRQ